MEKASKHRCGQRLPTPDMHDLFGVDVDEEERKDRPEQGVLSKTFDAVGPIDPTASLLGNFRLSTTVTLRLAESPVGGA